MKTRFAIWLGLGMTLLAAPGITRAALFNGSFESADLLGWSFHSDTGTGATEPFTRLAGGARPINSWSGPVGFNPGQLPVAGARFLALNTRANGNFLGNDSYDIVVSQNFSLSQGEFLSGWSFFHNGDSAPLDSAWVRVLDQNQNLVTTLWSEISGAAAQAQATVPPAWSPWQWSTPTAGNFTLQLGMTTSGANNAASYGFFDNVTISAQPVPEPTSMVLGLLGGLMLVVLRQRNR